MINYLQTSKNEKLKDIRKINEFKGKNIKFSIVKKSSTIYKDELPEINLPKPDKNILELLNIKWEYKGGKLSFKPDISDFSEFNNITINTMICPANESNVKGRAQSICIELVDNKGKSEKVEISKESNLINYPKGKLENLDFENGKEIKFWNQVTPISNIRIPMVLYNDIDLKNIKKCNIIFDRINNGGLKVTILRFSTFFVKFLIFNSYTEVRSYFKIIGGYKMKVKMITDYHENIEEQINKFLQENKDSIDVVDIKWKVYAMAHLVMIIYKEKEI